MKNKCKWFNICPLRKFEKERKLNLVWRNKYCLSSFQKCQRYIEALKKIPHPVNMLPDGSINKSLIN